MTLISQVMTIN